MENIKNNKINMSYLLFEKKFLISKEENENKFNSHFHLINESKSN